MLANIVIVGVVAFFIVRWIAISIINAIEDKLIRSAHIQETIESRKEKLNKMPLPDEKFFRLKHYLREKLPGLDHRIHNDERRKDYIENTLPYVNRRKNKRYRGTYHKRY